MSRRQTTSAEECCPSLQCSALQTNQLEVRTRHVRAPGRKWKFYCPAAACWPAETRPEPTATDPPAAQWSPAAKIRTFARGCIVLQTQSSMACAWAGPCFAASDRQYSCTASQPNASSASCRTISVCHHNMAGTVMKAVQKGARDAWMSNANRTACHMAR